MARKHRCRSNFYLMEDVNNGLKNPTNRENRESNEGDAKEEKNSPLNEGSALR